MTSLISVEDLHARLSSETRPVVLDVRWTLDGPRREAYEEGHVPAAVFVDLDRELAGAPGSGGRHPLPNAEALQASLRAAGVDQDRSVVVYDDSNGMSAARAWWLLRWSGHADVALLDGGFAQWTAAGLPVSTDVPTPTPGDFTVTAGRMPVLDADGAAELGRTGTLLDARTPQRYRGEVEPMDPRAGHIPGARNAPMSEHLSKSGRWRSATELAERFARIGVRADAPVGAYCGSGVSACTVVLALELAGVTTPDNPAALYPGSWSEWSNDTERPVAVGAEPGR